VLRSAVLHYFFSLRKKLQHGFYFVTCLHGLNIDSFSLLFQAASVGELRQHTLVGSDQAENASEDTPPDLKGSTSTNSMAAGQLLEQSRFVLIEVQL
jgi:hypothetical protein